MTSAQRRLTKEILTRGSDVLSASAGFQLVGRDKELAELSTILMKFRRRNPIVLGRGGVGVSAIVLGLQASKENYATPVDIVGKRLFWLNTDALFESGEPRTINDLHERARQILVTTPSAVLVVEDAADFIKSATLSGCSNLINALMGDLKSNRYQAILETTDEGLGELLRCDGDLLENCSLVEIKEPDAQNLRLIVAHTSEQLSRFHGVAITDAAREAAVRLTEKYKLAELRAQPDAAISLLDLALTHFCRQAHIAPQHIEVLRNELANARESSIPAAAIQAQVAVAEKEWTERQRSARGLHREISDGEEQIRALEDEIALLSSAHRDRMQTLKEPRGPGEELSLMNHAGAETPEIAEYRSKIQKIRSLVEKAASAYQRTVAEVYAGLSIGEGDVLRSFSTLSGIPVDTLSEDEREKLRNLEELLARRVIGQEEPTREVAKSVKRARLGLTLPNKPSGAFMFLGPSGVGKTELAKALAESLSVPLLRFDMSEYMEKHAVAKLIGAPPGYEGYEHGGILTNQVRRNPYSVVLFDEIEKAHTDVFNLMLQLLDDARLTDSRGLTASFKDTIVIMTTNIGTPHFLDETVPFDESKRLALIDLRAQYRPEFLGRFGGNIYAFKRLHTDVLEAIARKELSRINSLVRERGLELSMSNEDLRSMVSTVYAPREGARSVLGFIDRSITSAIAEFVLNESSARGPVRVAFERDTQRARLEPLASSPLLAQVMHSR